MKTEPSCVETPETLQEAKDLLQKAVRGHKDAPEEQDESNYVDLESVDVNPGGTNPENDCGVVNETNIQTKTTNNSGIWKCEEDVQEGPSDLSHLPCLNAKSELCFKSGDEGERAMTQPEVSPEDKAPPRAQGLHRSDHYLDGRSESDDFEEDDDVSLVLSDDCVPCVTEDESHYITTHEIQVSELSDHDEDYLGVGSSTSWDVENDNQVYSFVDYASSEGDAAVGERGDARQPRSQGGAAAVSTLLESDPCDGAKFTSSDESVSKPQQQQQQRRSGSSVGQIHLSIRTTSRAINDPGSIQEQGNILHHARRSGDTSRYVFRGVDGKAEAVCDRAKCFIAAPGRWHFGRTFRGKEVAGCSSGASSEPDDADKEVRNLTDKSFKSLAYPYVDAINVSASSESSASGINRWATFVDLQYGKMNMSRGLDQSVGSHQNSLASFEIAKNRDNKGYKGIALASIKPPPSKVFTLNGDPHRASSSKQMELMGGHSGVITLTETLNFRCNVKSGMSGGERITKFAHNAAGSRSTDEVTNSLPRRGASKSPSNTMEDTHKKATFASSMIQNVISKKMQFEQERKMERGEISERHPTPSPCFVHQESDGHRERGCRELRRRSSRLSESSAEYAIMCVDESGDFVANEAGIAAPKGELDASKSPLHRSQHSAFRCWKDEELELPEDHEHDQTPEKAPWADHGEGEQSSSGRGKVTKMSHLFVPSIQMLFEKNSIREAAQQLQNRNDCPYGDGGEIQLRPDNTSHSAATSKCPEIKMNLRSVRDNKTEPFGVSRPRAPNIDSDVRPEHTQSQALAAALKAESSDKVPHFMVRDIRDNKATLQTPIYQVRDVRKMVKSSYHCVSLDNNEHKSDSHSEQNKQMSSRNPNSVSPIVIKCQSVNTTSYGKQLSQQELFDTDRSSPQGDNNALLQRTAGRAPLGVSKDSSDGDIGLRIRSRAASMKQEKISDITDKKPESKIANQGPLEKLQAAVKTMEQLYKFEKNEWKRKNEQHLLTDSHVLSLIACEEHGGLEEDSRIASSMDRTARRDSYLDNDKTPPAPAPAAFPATDCSLLRQEDNDLPVVFQTPGSREDRLVARSMQGNKNMFSLSSSLKSQRNTITQTPFSTKSCVPKSPKLPVSLKESRTKPSVNEGSKSKEAEWSTQELFRASADNKNYLTIPVKSHASSKKQASSADQTSVYTFTTPTQPTTTSRLMGSGARVFEEHNQSPERSSIVMDTRSPEFPPATIYHSLPLGISTNQPQVYCFSPAITPAPTLDPFQATQRKMLLDPTTGSYYLVDTPVQSATKRLFDPETGQYVDVPMPQSPMTPLPMPISPLALSPGAYGHTYMIYPGFMPTPSVIQARTLVQSQMSMQSEAEGGGKALSQQAEGMYMDSPCYIAAYGAQQQAAINRPPQGFSGGKQPVISFGSQQEPRIMAPPSFDGTTMSFVLEHR
ncbi:uncharacterized protein C4orf54 homolog [Cyclopterus lumpus]|uniref:uncharacterized protein C4orf54 homolog n=1 Tax=Cyclopterus lumpus TaxID=8103 RepID=UPI0014861F04|nr:uncharacterized protein C4orf54 homolog [Cyclopterus lumpus]